jgi:PIN domain nuclease of toxin-antitoxin system
VLLAWLHEEPGSESVGELLPESSISSVNWSEVVQKALENGVDVAGMREELSALGLSIEGFTATQAELAAALRQVTRKKGLSLGDRASLALAQEKGVPVLTADRVWKSLRVGLQIQLLR